MVADSSSGDGLRLALGLDAALTAGFEVFSDSLSEAELSLSEEASDEDEETAKISHCSGFYKCVV